MQQHMVTHALLGSLLLLVSVTALPSPFDQYAAPNAVEMAPSHYCGTVAGCQPDPPGAASMGMDPATAAYPVAAMGWLSSTFDWRFNQVCFNLTGSREGPWPAGQNLGAGPQYVQLYDWATASAPTMAILFGPFNNVCKPVWNNTAGAWPTCYVNARITECPPVCSQNHGNMVFDFNTWNNAYTIIVNIRNSRLAIASVTLTDSTVTDLAADARTQAAFEFGNRKVNVPFTLKLTAINGETLTQTVAGVPTGGSFPSGNLGYTASINTQIQFTTNYDGSNYVPVPCSVNTIHGKALAVAIGIIVALFAIRI